MWVRPDPMGYPEGMSRVDIGYPKDAPPVVRLRTNYAPYETMRPTEAENLAADLFLAAREFNGLVTVEAQLRCLVRTASRIGLVAGDLRELVTDTFDDLRDELEGSD